MRLIDVLVAELAEWPDGEDYFTCDSDGEVRASYNIDFDFYPQNKVDLVDRSDAPGDLRTRGTEITRAEWEAARNV